MQREMILVQMPRFELHIDTRQIASRFTMWFLIGIGPFQRYLYLIRKASSKWCRYSTAGLAVESSQHLLFSCIGIPSELKFSKNGEINIDIKELDTKCRRLVQKLFRDHGRID